MIGFLDGRVAGRTGDGCFLNVGGVGYRLACSAHTVKSLPGEGESCRLFTHVYVREDVLGLFGFGTESEQRMFEALIGVNGVGPKVALQMCSAFTPDTLRRALATDDLAALSSVPGIGRKTAQRILMELKEKLAMPDLEIVGSGRPVLAEARSALENLGYSPPEVRAALAAVDSNPEASVEDVVRIALRGLA